MPLLLLPYLLSAQGRQELAAELARLEGPGGSELLTASRAEQLVASAYHAFIRIGVGLREPDGTPEETYQKAQQILDEVRAWHAVTWRLRDMDHIKPLALRVLPLLLHELEGAFASGRRN